MTIRPERPEDLLTPLAYTLSVSPPRAPPFDSAQRALLVGHDPRTGHLCRLHAGEGDQERIRRLVWKVLTLAHEVRRKRDHPYLEKKSSEGLTRFIGTTLLPVHGANYLRDNGWFRTVADTLVMLGIPALAIASPTATMSYLKISATCQRLVYGAHAMQTVDMMLPTQQSPTGLLFFAHGGAWGSGMPWMYRLVAKPFVEKLNMAVAIVGYRTYPDAFVDGQVKDLERAMSCIQKQFSFLFSTQLPNGRCVMGHSSGAHIALLQLVEHARRKMEKHGDYLHIPTCTYIGVSGCYDVCHHYDYEASRGVEEVSPMKASNGLTREALKYNSPAHREKKLLLSLPPGAMVDHYMPDMLFLHGIEDSTVPFTSTSEVARWVRSCGATKVQEIYLGKTGHQETIMEMMLGGQTQDKVIEWLRSKEQHRFKRCKTIVSIESRI